MKFDKVFLYNSISTLNKELRQPEFLPPKPLPLSCLCGEIIAFGIQQRTETKNAETIRIWRSNSYFGLWYDGFTSGKFLAALDYTIYENHIKIDYMNLYDSSQTYYEKCAQLTSTESTYLNSLLLRYVKKLARKESKQKVIVDVHPNLRIFDRYYLPNGFTITDRKSEDNPFWREAEFCLQEN